MECEVPEDPLAMGNVQNFADELSGPLFSINPVISHDQVLVLHAKEMPGYPAFHEVFPAYDVLAFCQLGHLWCYAAQIYDVFSASHEYVLGDPVR